MVGEHWEAASQLYDRQAWPPAALVLPAAALAGEEDGGMGLKRLAELAGGAVIAPSKASKAGKCEAALACRVAYLSPAA